MPYSRSWNVTDPPGTELARNIDDVFRRLRVDLDERLKDILVDIDADPWDLKAQYKGNVTGKIRNIGYPEFINKTSYEGLSVTGGWAIQATHGPVMAPVILPVGSTIKKLGFCADKADATQCYCILTRHQLNTSASENLVTVTRTASGKGITESAELTISVQGHEFYTLFVDSTDAGTTPPWWILYGCQVTYDVPDVRNTI